MPEMPEVQGLVDFLAERTTGRSIARISVAAISALRTYDPPIEALHGAEITGAARHGKFVDIEASMDGRSLHLLSLIHISEPTRH